MKIYNKKGLIWGVFWTIGVLFCLYRDIVDPHDFLPQQIKSVILSVLLLAMGVTGFVRAFSKRATIEDKTEERDERNKLVRLKGDAMVGNILFYVQMALMLAGVLAYAVTKKLVFGFLFLICGLNVSLCFILSIIFAVYYEKHV